MPRQYGDGLSIKPELPITEELYHRKCRKSEKPREQRPKRHNYPKSKLCVKCECPINQHLDQEIRRKKQSFQYQHCPSCHCQPNIDEYLYEKCPKEKNIEATLGNYENYLDTLHNAAKKRSKSPFSLPPGVPYGHCSKRGQNSKQNLPSKYEYTEEVLDTMYQELVNSGLTDENTEIFDKSSCSKEHYKDENQLQCNQEETELDSDCSKKTYTNHCHLKKDRLGCFEKSRESIEKCEIERDEELEQANRDCEELNQLTTEVKEYEKMKGMRQNFPEKSEQKQIKSRKEGDIPKKKTKFNKSTISRCDELSPDRSTFIKMDTHQRQKIEPSSSYQSLPKDDKDFVKDTEGDFSRQAQLQQEFKGSSSTKISRRSAAQNSQSEKSEKNNVEIMSLTNESEFKSREEALTEGRKSLYAGGDLDLHACKSYVVDLIDKALSKQLGTQPGQKKVDVNKNAPSWQEMCFEVTRALQGDYCQSFAQNLCNFQENMDNVTLLKRFRWAYVKHIQEQLRSLEKIIDI